MSGAIAPLLSTPSWSGAELQKRRDNCTFTFTLRILKHVVISEMCSDGSLSTSLEVLLQSVM
jgi:hypothetical protein